MPGGDDPDRIDELFSAFGPVAVRAMFGGAGIFFDGLMFALVADGVIYLKADARTIPAFEREGLGPFIYVTKAGERSLASYWRMPARLYDDADELARWACAALDAARQPNVRNRRGRRGVRKRR